VSGADADFEHRVPCRDANGRDRWLTVIVRHGELAVVTPPGESAVFGGREARGQLESLRRAIELGAERMRWQWPAREE